MRWLLSLVWIACLVGLPKAYAQQDARVCQLEPVPDHVVVIDGQLDEWQSIHFERIGSAPDHGLVYAFGYDDGGLYVAARVSDQRFIRTAFPSQREDAIVLSWLSAAPRARLQDIWLFAGVPGRIRAQGAVGAPGAAPRAQRTIQIVEAPSSQSAGYAFEAYIPWSVLGGQTRLRASRCSIRMVDVDSEARAEVVAVPASTQFEPRDVNTLPRIAIHDALGDAAIGLMDDRGIMPSQLAFDEDIDVTGDANVERVIVANDLLALLSSNGGQGTYSYVALNWPAGTRVVQASSQDLNNDGKLELILRRRYAATGGDEEAVEIFSFAEGRARRVFARVDRTYGEGDAVLYDGHFRIKPKRGSACTLEMQPVELDGVTLSRNFARFEWTAASRSFGAADDGQAPRIERLRE